MSPRWRLAAPLTVLIVIHLASLFGGFLAPNSAIAQNRDLPWAPPAKLRFVEADGSFTWWPFIYALTADTNHPDLYREDKASPCKLLFLARGDAYRFAGLFPTDLHFLGVEDSCSLYLFGTDGFGRDVFARTLIGGRVSLSAGLLATGLALGVGSFLGGLAGYLGKSTDAALMRVTELFLALPWLYLLLALRAFLPLSLNPLSSFLLLIAIVGLIGWAQPARILRGTVLSTRNSLFVIAAVGSGARRRRILGKHLFPHALPLIATQAIILIPRYILTEVTLSFLGLGVAQPTPTWGNLLAQLQQYHVLANHPHMLLPAFLLILVTTAYYGLLTSNTDTSSPRAKDA